MGATYMCKLPRAFTLPCCDFKTAMLIQNMSKVWRYAFVGFPASNPDRINLDPEPNNYWNFIQQILYNPMLSLVKSSVLVLLLRIGGHRARVRWSIYILNTLNLMLMAACLLVVIFQTIPIQATWDSTVVATHSINFASFATSTACITIASDVLVLAIPVWLFIGLQMRLALKLGLLSAFLLSGV